MTSAGLTCKLVSESATRSLGLALAKAVQPGDVLALIGDLGAGKTRLTQSLALGLGVPSDTVTSPTFTLIHEYQNGRLPLRHCDAYRLQSAEEFADLGLDELFAEDGVAIIEWADRVSGYLPRDRLELRLSVMDETTRQVEMTGTGPRGQQLVATLAERRPW
ncbi:tRNA (adenosine(37)-N6)-threonylcarbamoyltransferase complex ATPase subunit type 1 TsaE [bacterium]|nr:tRNA (adenosine(37)-N6)-threonylcarbamoyltransferase complex ATPase subunit type 1 TsaE [bacterium]